MKYFILFIGVIGLSACVCTDTRDAPEVISKALPVDCDHTQTLPVQAVNEQIKGWVLLAYYLDKNGYPIDMEVIDSNPKGYFEEAALTTYSACRFVKTAEIAANERLMMNLDFNYAHLRPYTSIYAQQ
ncbi:energy transducer TonB [Shewanella surugensis]|uniref:Energy transducer TonB n=1 Tax=Shewanella surugensis TaxID=212020 RepID=A0ABT0LFB5_9GAMM|nr:energy transducer TonB [Shewanella surugensis]MCL1126401.1 energy transducer TonB [Shewanella surugensis]